MLRAGHYTWVSERQTLRKEDQAAYGCSVRSSRIPGSFPYRKVTLLDITPRGDDDPGYDEWHQEQDVLMCHEEHNLLDWTRIDCNVEAAIAQPHHIHRLRYLFDNRPIYGSPYHARTSLSLIVRLAALPDEACDDVGRLSVDQEWNWRDHRSVMELLPIVLGQIFRPHPRLSAGLRYVPVDMAVSGSIELAKHGLCLLHALACAGDRDAKQAWDYLPENTRLAFTCRDFQLCGSLRAVETNVEEDSVWVHCELEMTV